MSAKKEIFVSGKKAQELADALSATHVKIIKLTQKEPLCITCIAKRLNISEPYISESVRILEALGLVNIKYERGTKGIRKIVSTDVDRIIISLKDEETSSSSNA